ncbi:hypothetical protein [Cryobacterium sp. HLT2-28]|nr:hypothetical protein [Cryobacterium sp. HLT2-28]
MLRRRGIHLDEVTAATPVTLTGYPAMPPGTPELITNELITNQGRTS